MRARLRPTPLQNLSRISVSVLWMLPVLAGLQLGCGSSSTGAVSTIIITPANAFLAINAQESFTATANDSKGKAISGATFTWLSSAPDIASVDSSGVVTGHNVGSAQITASTSGINSAAAVVTVVNSSTPVTSVALSPISASIKAGQTQQFTATAKDVNGNVLTNVTFTWQNSAAGVAIISTTGLATGIAPGMTVITASVGSVTSPAATLTVTP
jgi:uncharacterized protein YjdB